MHIATNILVVELIACDQALLHFESYNDDCGGGKGPGAYMVACCVRVVFSACIKQWRYAMIARTQVHCLSSLDWSAASEAIG